MLYIYHGDNHNIMNSFPRRSFNLIYLDPPFNTGKLQKDKKGLYEDAFDDYIDWIGPKLELMRDLLTDNGSIFIHLDYREVHYVKVFMDKLFGRSCFMNEIIWLYDFGAKQTKKWSTKHDNILWYVKNPKDYVFKLEEVDKVPKIAPSLPSSKNRKDKHLKLINDFWWQTVVPTNGKERTGYPTQKPLGILERIVRVHSNKKDHLLDPFAGSGTFGEAGAKQNRNVTLIDNNQDAIDTMTNRFSKNSYDYTIKD